MKICVFLGPSLDITRASDILDAEYFPPVKMGDIFRVCKQSPDAIVIIDGIFEQTPAVWHKEILYAIDKGIPVYGASSMGALRAAELDTFGMIGIGKIYEDFAAGKFEDDDEVAVVHANDGDHTVQSEAMVNIRYALNEAVRQGVIDAETENFLISEAKTTFYPERSWDSLFTTLALKNKNDSCHLAQFIRQVQPNQKRDDAITCLKMVDKACKRSALPSIDANFHFESTVYWETVERYFGYENTDENLVVSEKLRNHIRIFSDNKSHIIQNALYFHLIKSEASRLDYAEVNDKIALQRFRYQRNLLSAQSLSEWLVKHNISNDECIGIARIEYMAYHLESHYINQIDANLTLSAKALNYYSSEYAAVAAKQDILRQWGIVQLSEADVGSQQHVLNWYESEYGSQGMGFDEHMYSLGFGEPRVFLNELFEQFIFTQNSAASPKISRSQYENA